MLRRIITAFVTVAFVSATWSAPVRAMSTAQEVSLGKLEDEDIVRGSVLESDPLMVAYVSGIAQKLWAQRARTDVDYQLRVVKDDQINSFATMGGYVYIDEGIVDFSQSDDELAFVIAHETGHNERRHVVTQQTKSNVLDILFGLASLFSPLIYNFGGLAEQGILSKLSRADELQADRYGIQMMARAGYNPQAAVTSLGHLGVEFADHNDLVTKYFQDHPPSNDRIAHALGYPELDPKVVTEQQELVRAAADEEHARFNVASIEFNKILKQDPNNTEALVDLAQAQLALGQTSKSAQTLAEVAQNGDTKSKALATERLAALRDIDARRVNLTQPNLGTLHASVQQAQNDLQAAATQIEARRQEGFDQLKASDNRIQEIEYEVPNLSNVQARNGTRIDSVIKNLELMSRSINSGLQDAGDTITNTGSLEKSKNDGPYNVLRDSKDLLHQMQSTLESKTLPADAIAVLPAYPIILDEVARASADSLRAVDAARAATLMMDQGLGNLDAFLRELDRTQINFSGDMDPGDYQRVLPLMQNTLTALDKAAVAASQAAQLSNMARSRQNEARLTLLGLGTSPERYATLRYALKQRFGNDGISYEDMLKDNLTPGDVTVASILAADVKSTPDAIIAEARANHRSMVDEADARGMHAWPLEIFTGLVYLDYADDPALEIRAPAAQT